MHPCPSPSQWHMGCIMCPCPSHREEEDLPCKCALPGIDVPDEDDVEVIPGGGDGRGSSQQVSSDLHRRGCCHACGSFENRPGLAPPTHKGILYPTWGPPP